MKQQQRHSLGNIVGYQDKKWLPLNDKEPLEEVDHAPCGLCGNKTNVSKAILKTLTMEINDLGPLSCKILLCPVCGPKFIKAMGKHRLKKVNKKPVPVKNIRHSPAKEIYDEVKSDGPHDMDEVHPDLRGIFRPKKPKAKKWPDL